MGRVREQKVVGGVRTCLARTARGGDISKGIDGTGDVGGNGAASRRRRDVSSAGKAGTTARRGEGLRGMKGGTGQPCPTEK